MEFEFEFDAGKSKINKRKHGIDFVEAQALWDDPDFIEIPVKVSDEPRFLVIGKISEKHWSEVITYRTEKIRIISVRRSRKEEVDLYESPRI
ncbi:MAG TPA: toxin [Nitrospiraceae bacterium]|nr:toxin [Nitrospiraceae bacterium]